MFANILRNEERLIVFSHLIQYTFNQMLDETVWSFSLGLKGLCHEDFATKTRQNYYFVGNLTLNIVVEIKKDITEFNSWRETKPWISIIWRHVEKTRKF